ncbi:MAG: glycoside hydrolase family 16 protein [Bacteroidales bacterium]|nr:glycoside hydrolase family 16 protein [Bacteroidales bacterium]
MRLKSLITISFACLTLGVWAADPQTGSGETDGYKLVWQDLFDAAELNPDRWNIEVNNGGGGNNELQYYTDRESNVRIGDDGNGNRCLILTARRENYGNRAFTSGRVNSKNLTVFTHGKIEAAIRMPKTANGLWPAFWMMGNDFDAVGWPRCGETDIVEMGHQNAFAAGTQERFFNGACHWGQGWPAASYAKDTTKSYSLQDGEYHLFTVIWDEQSIKMYVDLDRIPKQTPYYKIDIPHNDPGNEWSAGNYFHKNNFIIFNLAVGGNFPGIFNASGITALNADNGNEASMYVNYVKVYQRGTSDEDMFAMVPGDSQSSGVESAVADTCGGHITVEGREAVCDGADITVYTVAGAPVAEGRTRIDMSMLPAGIYIITACGAHATSSIKTILK